MGQSVVDLPDPLDQSAAASLNSTTPAGVDDLLAQMAGDEVDRLLAEAEMPRESRVEPPAPPVLAAPDGALTVTALGETSARSSTHGESSGSHSSNASVDPKIDAELSSATTIAERSGLEMPAEPTAAEAPAFSEAETEAIQPPASGLPWYFKALEWMNAPMQSLPEGVREAVGKIALLTLFNAGAVLLYVFLFRKHR